MYLYLFVRIYCHVEYIYGICKHNLEILNDINERVFCWSIWLLVSIELHNNLSMKPRICNKLSILSPVWDITLRHFTSINILNWTFKEPWFIWKLSLHYSVTTNSHRLVRAQQIWAILSMGERGSLPFFSRRDNGTDPRRIWYFCLTVPMILSTWIRTFATFLVISTSMGLNWFLFFIKVGNTISVCKAWNESSMSKPRSARIKSPGNRWLNKPQFSVKWTSDVRPPQAFDMNVKHPVEQYQWET